MLEPGAVVAGKYRVERLLGAGGMGIVAIATHVQLDQRVAIKALHERLAGNRDVVERMVREARAVAQLKSEHVCRVSDVGLLDGGAPYLVMELLDGRDLARVIGEGVPPPADAIDYVAQACVALAEAHARGIVHRDLKPANLFLTRRLDGTPLVKVLDFGIAKAPAAAGELTETDAVMGTPGYMAPEQLRSARDVDARADVWALGVILYQLLSGRLPFPATSATEAAVKIAMDPPDAIDVAPALRAVVLRCLEKDRARRFHDVAELAQALVPFGAASTAASAGLARKLLGESGVAATLPAGSGLALAETVASTLQGAAGESRVAVSAPEPVAPRARVRWWIPATAIACVAIAAGAWVGDRNLARYNHTAEEAVRNVPTPPPTTPLPPVPVAEVTLDAATIVEPAPTPPPKSHGAATAKTDDDYDATLAAAQEAAMQGDYEEELRLARILIARKPTDLAYRLATDGACFLPDAAAVAEYAKHLSPKSYQQMSVYCSHAPVKLPPRGDGAAAQVDQQAFRDAIAKHRCTDATVLAGKVAAVEPTAVKQATDCLATRKHLVTEDPTDPRAEEWLLAWVDELGTTGTYAQMAANLRDTFYSSRATLACKTHDRATASTAFGKLQTDHAKQRVQRACTPLGVDLP